MMILKAQLLACLIETGHAPAGSKIDIVSIEGEAYSDYRRVEVTITKKRCSKPFVCWNLCVDIVRQRIHWDTSTFYYMR